MQLLLQMVKTTMLKKIQIICLHTLFSKLRIICFGFWSELLHLVEEWFQLF